MPEYLSLSPIQVALAALLILINGGVSVALRLRLERTLLLASVRTVVQLLLVGGVLGWVFAQQNLPVVLALASFMTFVAGIAAVSRLGYSYKRVYWDTTFAMWASSWLIGVYAVTLIFRGIQPWYKPQYVVPILGMILGNTLNGISIGLDSILQAFVQRQQLIESRLSFGANRWEACQPELSKAIASGMTPIINSMMIVGLVSLPGMMTGQLISGTKPWDAVQYQIVLMFLIASATALGTVLATVLACRRLLSPDHRLQRDRIAKRGGK